VTKVWILKDNLTILGIYSTYDGAVIRAFELERDGFKINLTIEQWNVDEPPKFRS